ncbi:MAG: MnmC family methyltransferase [Pseudomonadota bacterium]
MPIRHGGTLLDETSDADGVIEVVQHGDLRTLHFGTPAIQSAINLAKPDGLELDYTQRMLLGAFLAPELHRVLLIGLGGGSMARFLYRHFHAARIDVIEKRPATVALAHKYFQLPEGRRLKLIIGDACEWLPRLQPEYDLILLDAFDAEGPVAALHTVERLQQMRELLHPAGILALNHWARKRTALRQLLDDLAQVFARQPYHCFDVHHANLVLFAHRFRQRSAPAAEAGLRAAAFDRAHGTGFYSALQAMKWSCGTLRRQLMYQTLLDTMRKKSPGR